MQEKNKRRYNLNVWVALGTALVVFFVSSIWYGAFGGILATLSDVYVDNQNSSFLWTMLFEFLRSFIIVLTLYYLILKLGISECSSSVKLGAILWLFPLFILLGSTIHEDYLIVLALIHAGDWLVKLLLISVILGWSQQRKLKAR